MRTLVLVVYFPIACLVAVGSGLPAATASAAEPTATPIALHYGAPRSRTILVMAIATDVPTSSRVSVEAAAAIAQAGGINDGFEVGTAPPDWKISDLVGACAHSDGNLAGALVIYNAVSRSGVDGFLLFNHAWTVLDYDAMLVECKWDEKQVWEYGGVVQWFAHDLQGYGANSTVPILPLAAIAAAVQSYRNKPAEDTTQRTITVVPPSPNPPGNPYVSGVQTTHKITSNGATTDQPTFVGLAVLSQFSSSSVAIGSASTDPQFKKALQNTTRSLLHGIGEACSRETSRDRTIPRGAVCSWFSSQNLRRAR